MLEALFAQILLDLRSRCTVSVGATRKLPNIGTVGFREVETGK